MRRSAPPSRQAASPSPSSSVMTSRSRASSCCRSAGSSNEHSAGSTEPDASPKTSRRPSSPPSHGSSSPSRSCSHDALPGSPVKKHDSRVELSDQARPECTESAFPPFCKSITYAAGILIVINVRWGFENPQKTLIFLDVIFRRLPTNSCQTSAVKIAATILSISIFSVSLATTPLASATITETNDRSEAASKPRQTSPSLDGDAGLLRR
jgi:hypothetical protein